MSHDCPFCESTQRILKENELAYVLLSNPRKVAGHFLVIPKRHVEKTWELTREEISAIFELVFFVQRRLVERFSQGCDVRQGYRPFLKQSRLKVDHIHFHILPRDLEDELYQRVEKHETDLFQDLHEEEFKRMRVLLQD